MSLDKACRSGIVCHPMVRFAPISFPEIDGTYLHPSRLLAKAGFSIWTTAGQLRPPSTVDRGSR